MRVFVKLWSTVRATAQKATGSSIPKVMQSGPGAAKNLREQLAIKAAAGQGSRIMRGLNDPRLLGKIWDKYQYVYGNGPTKITVHYIQNRVLPFIKKQFKIKR